MPRTVESAADRQKRLDRERRRGVVDMGDPEGNVEMGPVTFETSRRPAGAREVSREEFERIRRGGRAVSGIDDVEIGDAVMEAPEEEDAEIARFNVRPSGAPESSTRRAETSLSVARGEIPPEWIRGGARAETQASANEREASERARVRARRDQESRRDAAYQRSLLEGAQMDNRLQALGEGAMQGVTLGFGDELAGLGRSAVHGGSYEGNRDSARRDMDVARDAEPGWYAGGEVLGSLAPALAVPGGTGNTLSTRLLSAGRVGGAFGSASGLGHSRGSATQQAQDTVAGGVFGAAGGVAGQLAGEGLAAGVSALRGRPRGTPDPGADFTPEQRAQIEVDVEPGGMRDLDYDRAAAEQSAARHRVSSVAERPTLADMRRAGDYHGQGGEGYEGLARDLDAYGIQPRRSLDSAADVQRRAEFARRESGAAIGDVRERMGRQVIDMEEPTEAMRAPAEATAFDDMPTERRHSWEMAPGEYAYEYTGADQLPGLRDAARARNAALSERMRGIEARAEEPTGSIRARPRPRSASAEIDMSDPAYQVPDRLAPQARLPERQMVSYAQTAQGLRQRGRQALQASATPESRAAAQRMIELADEFEARPPSTFAQAEEMLSSLDDEAAYGTRGPIPNGVTPDQVARARTTRGLVRRDMDSAVERTLSPDEYAQYRRDRGRYGAASATRQFGERSAERQAAASPVGLNDNIMAAAGLSRPGSWVERGQSAIENVVVGRWLRGRGHALAATANEIQGDMLARQIVRRLNGSEATRSFGAQLESSMRQGGRSFGLALLTMTRRNPAVAEVVAPILETPQQAQRANDAAWRDNPAVPFADDVQSAADDDTEDLWRNDPNTVYEDEIEERR